MLKKILILIIFFFSFKIYCLDISFSGDMMLSRYVKKAIKRRSLNCLLDSLRIIYKDYDYNVVNLECAITANTTPVKNKKYIFKGDSDYPLILRKNFITHAVLANNHSYDYGIDGLNETIENLTKANVFPIGIEQHNSAPAIMKTNYWDKKSLSTSLAGWSALKHDMILYSEQPYCAQGGEGGGPPPPMHVSYVEPNILFWKKAVQLLELEQETLKSFNMNTDRLEDISNKLIDLGNFLLEISEKELRKETISDKEFSRMSWIGAEIENLLTTILQTDHFTERERYMSLVADTYTYENIMLENGIGLADEIYVVAEINGRPYITKGAVFSYYEFKSNKRLTDGEWIEMLKAKKMPERPKWIDKYLIKTKGLNSKFGYRF